jgi:hypothetical protein
MRLWLIAMALIFGGGPAFAQSAEGSGALALSAIVGGDSPRLSAGQKAALAQLLAGDSGWAPKASKITVDVDRILCRAGNVDITAFGCDLMFGAKTVHLSGRRANELFATLGDVGVASDGAAGTIYRGLYKLSCTIDPHEVAEASGGGADCAYALEAPLSANASASSNSLR